MKFNINMKASAKLPKLKDSSVSIFFVENKGKKTDVSEIIKLFDIALTPVRKKEIESDGISSVKIQTEKRGEIIVKKYKKDELTVDYFRDELSSLTASLNSEIIKELIVVIPGYADFSLLFPNEIYFYQTFAEGTLLGNYDFDVYKSKKSKPVKLSITFASEALGSLNKALNKAEKIIDSVAFARNLVNEPAITLTPLELVKRVKKEFSGSGIIVKVLDERALRKNKMNAILSVGKGSDNPPMMLVLEYKPRGAKGKIALVGKGVTYDSGGYSIKPTDGMVDMKGDMAGAATVIGAMKAVDALSLKKEVIGIIPLVENLINGKAYKPGDIVSTSSGKTIEVKNTDAEGRIILADALEYASKLKPNAIIDFATLTGACVVALGEFAAGLFTKEETLSNKLIKAGNKTYEMVWPLPFNDVYKKLLKSDIADISNLGPRWGGAITAAKFLENFVDENIPYVHLDIAGPALKHELSSYTKKWATGFGVRLMADFLEEN